MFYGRINRYFFFTVISATLTTTFDILAIYLDNISSHNLPMRYLSHGIYIFFHSLTIPVYVTYLVSLTDTWHKLQKHTLSKLILSVPIIGVISALIFNIFEHKLFFINENYDYIRDDLFPIVYIAGFIYACVGVFYIYHYRQLFKPSRFIALISIILLVTFATIFQMFFPTLPIEMFATSVGLLIVSMLIQRPEENMDNVTNLNKLTAYTTDIKRSEATDKPFDIILINFSNFDSIRDILGYDATNELLLEIANKLKELNRKTKLHANLYYIDKGHFRLIIERQFSHNTEMVAALIANAFKFQLNIRHMDINLITHVCIVKYPEDINSYDMLMHFGGRFSQDNSFSGEVLYAKDIFNKSRYDLYTQLDSIIENAITNRNFQVYYQPIYSTKENRFTSAEALLRLKDETHGFIPPDVFIPAAEQSGAIHRIGEYVIDEVCQFIASEDFAKLSLDYIEINLSVAQCMHKDLPSLVIDTLHKYNVSPDKINLEITETATAHSQNTMLENIQKLNDAGISFSLDDYGTGYSNIQRVSTLPLKIVKLDRTFVNAEENPKLHIVLENTVKMLKDLDLEIVAEGIETESMVNRFADMNCEYIQGYYYSKPIPKHDFISFILKHNK